MFRRGKVARGEGENNPMVKLTPRPPCASFNSMPFANLPQLRMLRYEVEVAIVQNWRRLLDQFRISNFRCPTCASPSSLRRNKLHRHFLIKTFVVIIPKLLRPFSEITNICKAYSHPKIRHCLRNFPLICCRHQDSLLRTLF